jgi:hypothetical protein
VPALDRTELPESYHKLPKGCAQSSNESTTETDSRWREAPATPEVGTRSVFDSGTHGR